MPEEPSFRVFDPKTHLTSADLRDLEKRYRYNDLPSVAGNVCPHGHSGMKIAKAQYETQLLVQTCLEFTEATRLHPPYGLMKPPILPSMVIAPQAMSFDIEYFSDEETQIMQKVGSMNSAQALLDLKMQIILSDLFRRVEQTPEFQSVREAGNGNAAIVTDGRSDTWKQIVQSAASNAKRSEFVVLKQIMVQWLKTSKRLPTEQEFRDTAAQSMGILEMLATTHQAIFKAINERILADHTLGNLHELVLKDGKPSLVLKKSIINKLDVTRGQPRTRTMCAGLLAKHPVDGKSLLEHSFVEDTQFLTEMLYDENGVDEERFRRFAAQSFRKPSVHTFLGFQKYDFEVREMPDDE